MPRRRRRSARRSARGYGIGGSWLRPWSVPVVWFGAALAGCLVGIHWVKRIGKRDFLHVARIFVVEDLRIDVEDHRHPHRFARLQGLLGEAEALDFGEISAGLRGGHVEG